MKIIVNGKEKVVENDSVTVKELLVINNVEMPDMVTVQKNGVFVDREEYSSTRIKEGDEVDFLFFMGGGTY